MRFEQSIEIRADAHTVWRIMSDVERWPEWTASVSTVTRKDRGALGIGSKVDVKQPRLATAHFTITTWEPERGFTWIAANPAVTAVADHRIETTPTGCRVTLSVDFRGPLASVVGWFYGRLTTRYIAMEAEGLKRRSESA